MPSHAERNMLARPRYLGPLVSSQSTLGLYIYTHVCKLYPPLAPAAATSASLGARLAPFSTRLLDQLDQLGLRSATPAHVAAREHEEGVHLGAVRA